MTITNPYIFGNPVKDKEMFFGRDDVFQFLREHLIGTYQDNVVMLYGQRRTGKTSILYQLLNDYKERIGDLYIPVLISLEGLQDVETNAKIFFEIAVNIASRIQLAYPNENGFDSANSYFRHEFLKTVKTHLGDKKLLLMIDEYEVLETCAENPNTHVNKNLFYQIRQIMQHFDWISFILVGSHKLDELNLNYWKEFTGTVFHNISFIDIESARKLILEPAYKAASITYNSKAVEYLLELSGAHPYFLQALCHFVFANSSDNDLIEIPDIEIAVNHCMEAIRNGFESIWNDLTNDEKLVLAASSSLDSAKHKISEIVGQLDHFKVDIELDQITNAIKRLIYKDILKRNDEIQYQYCVPFFHKCIKLHQTLDKILDNLKISQKKHENFIGDPKILKAKQYLRDAAEYAHLNKLQIAERMFQSAIEVCPYYIEGWLKYGNFYESQNELDQALELYQEGLKQNPDSVDISNSIGFLFKKLHLNEEALRQFQCSLKIQENNSIALVNIDEIRKIISLQQKTIKLLLNPFIVGPPVVHVSMLYGRDILLNDLLEIVIRSQNVLLIGPRRIGKTSVLYHLKERIPPSFISVLIDCSIIQDSKDLLHLIYKDISKIINTNRSTDFSSNPYLEFDNFIDSILDQDMCKGLVLIFDEYELIFKHSIGSDLSYYLRHMAMEYPVSLVMAGSHHIFELEENYDNYDISSPFYNIFTTRKIGLLDITSCRALITQPICEYLSYTNEAVEQIIILTGQHPYLIQLFCSYLVDLARNELKTLITIDDVNKNSTKIINTLQYFFRYLWDHLEENDRDIIKDIIYLNKKIYNKESLKTLEDNFIVSYKENQIVFQIGLFEKWLKKNHPWEK